MSAFSSFQPDRFPHPALIHIRKISLQLVQQRAEGLKLAFCQPLEHLLSDLSKHRPAVLHQLHAVGIHADFIAAPVRTAGLFHQPGGGHGLQHPGDAGGADIHGVGQLLLGCAASQVGQPHQHAVLAVMHAHAVDAPLHDPVVQAHRVDQGIDIGLDSLGAIVVR